MNNLLMRGCDTTLDYLDGSCPSNLRADFELESEPAMEFRFRSAIQNVYQHPPWGLLWDSVPFRLHWQSTYENRNVFPNTNSVISSIHNRLQHANGHWVYHRNIRGAGQDVAWGELCGLADIHETLGLWLNFGGFRHDRWTPELRAGRVWAWSGGSVSKYCILG